MKFELPATAEKRMAAFGLFFATVCMTPTGPEIGIWWYCKIKEPAGRKSQKERQPKA
jgi:hypothetical protein